MGNSKLWAIVGYITWIGFIVSIILSDKDDHFVRFHLNQALVLNILSIIASIISVIPLVGGIVSWVLGILIFIGWIIALIGAAQGNTKPLPLIDKIQILK